jgi:glucose/arabinose dehydrogenase
MTTCVDHSTAKRRRVLRALIGALSVLVTAVLVACTAPANTSSSDTAASATSTTAVDTGTGPTTISKNMRATEVADGFTDATNIVSRPMRNQLWVTQRSGVVRAIEIETSWNQELGRSQRNGFKTFPNPIIDLSSDVATEGEGGLLGIAFSTDARTLFLSYVDKKGELIVAAWNVNDPLSPPTTTPAQAAPVPSTNAPTTTRPLTSSSTQPRREIAAPIVDTGSRRVLLSIAHEGTTNYSGELMLGRDGFLYIGVGDSPNGSGEKTAQNPETLSGKILRIDPGGANIAESYVIPPGNPYAKGGGAPQIWSIGVQNPLRFSFDRANGNMWVVDAGRAKFAEIDYLPVTQGAGAGANLGWPYKDGKEAGLSPDGAPSTLVTPLVVAPANGTECPLIGGFVYRGSITELQGVFIYGEHCSGVVRGLLQRKGVVLDDKAIGPQLGANSIMAFAEDNQGELYVVTTGGSVQRLAAA